ncbi:MAG: zinc-binding dehydrogenase [Alphaproteobacteria bacterium]|jgi:propanol-preferring alcohol dehydrogenase|nr:zinc-binding dehydrogenase [Alphaproteobacteria bacterium]
MTTMLAARLHEAGKPLQIDEVAVPEPAAGEVLVKVKACGLCGTDIHLAIVGDLPVSYTPITLGHESAGSVAALGPGVEDFFAEGDRVALYPSASCGRCRYCLGGRESLCAASQVYGMAREGGLAEYITAPARSLLRLPAAVPFDVGAVVTDGIATPFHALRARGRLQPGETVGVFGCGGLGTHAIQFARLMGAAGIIAVDIDGPARERALELGADLALDPGDDGAAKQIRRQLGRGLDLALEFVGRADTVELALRCLDKAGRLVVVGVGMERPKLPPLAAFVGLEQAVLGSFGMDRADIEDIYSLIVAGRIDLSESVSARYPLAEADAALKRLASKEAGVVRVVVEP